MLDGQTASLYSGWHSPALLTWGKTVCTGPSLWRARCWWTDRTGCCGSSARCPATSCRTIVCCLISASSRQWCVPPISNCPRSFRSPTKGAWCVRTISAVVVVVVVVVVAVTALLFRASDHYVLRVFLVCLLSQRVTSASSAVRHFWYFPITSVDVVNTDFTLPRQRTKFAERAFSHAWNALPEHLRALANPANFKVGRFHYGDIPPSIPPLTAVYRRRRRYIAVCENST